MSPVRKLFTCWSDACIHANYDSYGELFGKSMILGILLVPVVVGGIFLWSHHKTRKNPTTGGMP
jgi:hypothetical protein